ncbi:Hsp20 family protein [Piscirickettsia litoralis]|uniref:Heat-shock protein n=1 Tax=Piscirickettsia litoralis TaxID=1891921 RepID=A0ABX3A8P2_9GAMM|nr:Hsp20 family protein [Piscirickettsia litoralis]ODN42494.1 heat-shock protein [Piscirickettsia litoralis]
MSNFNLSPLFRTSVGFDRILNMMDDLTERQPASYPPYNIEMLAENNYQITMAIAGFAEENIDIQQEQNSLIVTGKIADAKVTKERKFLHKGIAERAFKQEFQLEDHVKVTGAALENGLLHISLVREIPEAMKPRKITISSAGIDNKAVEQKSSIISSI